LSCRALTCRDKFKTQQFGPKAHQAIEARQLVRDSDPNFETSLVELFAGTHVAHPQVIAVLDAHGRGWSDSLTRDNCEMSMSQGPEEGLSMPMISIVAVSG
jgi:hypothetical protein